MIEYYDINIFNNYDARDTREKLHEGEYYPKDHCYENYLLLLLLKEVGSARLRESDQHPISPKTPAPQYQPIDRKKRKWKIVEDYIIIIIIIK